MTEQIRNVEYSSNTYDLALALGEATLGGKLLIVAANMTAALNLRDKIALSGGNTIIKFPSGGTIRFTWLEAKRVNIDALRGCSFTRVIAWELAPLEHEDETMLRFCLRAGGEHDRA